MTTERQHPTTTHTSALARGLTLGYGVLSYAVFFATFLYSIGFIGGFGVPTTLDGHRLLPWGSALGINLGLLTLFALQHSVMARPAFKRWWTRLIPAAIERSTYVLASSLALIAVFVFWQPLGGMVWQLEHPTVRAALFTAYGAGWALVLYATFLINHFDLFGLRQVWLAYRSKPYTQLKFVTPWLYRIIRHPLYLGWLMVFWFTPTMSLAHLLFAVVTTAYLFVGIRLEESDLKREHPGYADYQQRVPMIVPGLSNKAVSDKNTHTNQKAQAELAAQ
ncbi:MAG: methanethiol S-methyltransferase [Pseudomonadota bacterium]